MNSNRFSVKNNHVTAVFHNSISSLTNRPYHVKIFIDITKGKHTKPWKENTKDTESPS